ncbi:hypothetical protein BSKO_00922 [Bryopsis sp. KO-2023]|nr:hypothetical protein BSKO_00922 [Bryopsis sp. KO-2023]
MSKSGALATRPRRETLSAYEKAQIYMSRKQEEEERAAQASRGKSLCDSSGNEINAEGDHKDSTSPESKANLKRLVTTGMSRGSTQGSSDWLHAWGVDSDMKKGFDMNDSFPELEKPSQTPREADEEDDPAGGKKSKDKSKTFSKVKEALKSKLRRSKNQQDESHSDDDGESVSCKP